MEDVQSVRVLRGSEHGARRTRHVAASSREALARPEAGDFVVRFSNVTYNS